MLTGHLDVEGGAMFPTPGHRHHLVDRPPARPGARPAGGTPGCAARPRCSGQAPLSCLAEEIATPGEGQVRALITIAGNPVLSAPDAGRLDEALPMLDAMISIDNYLNETTRHAHVILPGPLAARAAALRRGAVGLRRAQRGALVAGDLRRRRPARTSGRSCIRLGAILGGHRRPPTSTSTRSTTCCSPHRAARHGVDAAEVDDAAGCAGPDRIVDLTVRIGPWGDGYGERPDGLTLERLQASTRTASTSARSSPRIDDILRTASGDVELAHDDILGDLARLARAHGRAADRRSC